jgi:hypothetical protein
VLGWRGVRYMLPEDLADHQRHVLGLFIIAWAQLFSGPLDRRSGGMGAGSWIDADGPRDI